MVLVAWFEHWFDDTSGVVRTLVQCYQWRGSNIGSMVPVAWFEHWFNGTSGVVRTLVQ